MTSLPRWSTRLSAISAVIARPNLSKPHFVSHLRWNNESSLNCLVYGCSPTWVYLEIVGKVSDQEFAMDTTGYCDIGEMLSSLTASSLIEWPSALRYALLWDKCHHGLDMVVGLLQCGPDACIRSVFDSEKVRFAQGLYRHQVSKICLYSPLPVSCFSPQKDNEPWDNLLNCEGIACLFRNDDTR
jgi:hypothetical protein